MFQGSLTREMIAVAYATLTNITKEGIHMPEEKKERVRGSNITLLEERRGKEDEVLFGIVASQDENLRTEADVRKWMDKIGSEGTLYQVRFGKSITRKIKQVGAFS